MSNHSPEKRLQITPHTKRNGLAITLFAAILILVLLYLNQSTLNVPLAVFIAGFGFALVTGALGVAKLLEPPTSLQITPEEIQYIHRKGQWTLRWDDIVRFDIPRVRRGLEQHELPFIGFRLHSYDQFLQQLSPRMAVHLMIEQRQLMGVALRSEKPAHRDYAEYYDVPTRWKSPAGKTYTGVYASFAARMEYMRELLGYDLYISQNAFDRDPESFRAFLNELQQHRHSS